MALTKAQIAKLQKDLAKAEADLAKAKTAAAKKPVAPTSGVVPGFTPTVAMPAPAKQSGEKGFVGPVAPKAAVPGVNPISGAPTPGPVVGFTPPVMPEPAVEPGGPGFTGPVAPIAPVAPVVPIVPPKPLKEERTMAIDTFKNTLALYFGKGEMSQPWVNALYGAVSKYYKTGSTVDESLNLALQDVRTNPELSSFTKRFKGLYDLQDKVAKGEAIEMPTIAEFFKSQQALGDVMRSAGFQDLATQEFLGDVLGTGKSVAETTALITDVFAAIDNAPEQLKRDLQTVAPGADRTSIAKALLLGSQGAAALNKQIAATTVLSAAKSQGLVNKEGLPTVSAATAADYAARGFGYNESLTGFGNVARGMVPYQKLVEISAGKGIKPEEAQTTMQQAIFENNVAAQEKIRLETEKEGARFGARSGTMGSRSLASRNRANRVI